MYQKLTLILYKCGTHAHELVLYTTHVPPIDLKIYTCVDVKTDPHPRLRSELNDCNTLR